MTPPLRVLPPAPTATSAGVPRPRVADDPRFSPGAAAVVLWDHEANAGVADPAAVLVDSAATVWWRCLGTGHTFRSRPLTALYRGCPTCRP